MQTHAWVMNEKVLFDPIIQIIFFVLTISTPVRSLQILDGKINPVEFRWSTIFKRNGSSIKHALIGESTR